MYALLFNLFNMESMFAMKITIKQYKNILIYIKYNIK